MKTRTHISTLLYLMLSRTLALLISCSQQEKGISIESLLKEMIDRDAIASFPQKCFRLRQEGSYNRASTSPEDTLGWFTNHDFNAKETDPNFIRIETYSR